MGGGFAQVGILLVLTVIVLPCGFFTLLALLDRFERSLATDETMRADEAKSPAASVADLAVAPFAAVADVAAAIESVGGDVVALPISVSPSPITPSAATG